MDGRCRIDLLGEMRATQDGRVITRFQTQKTGALLAYLAYHPRCSHPREVLCDLLWTEDDLLAARHKLRVALSSLRRQLEPPGVPPGAVIVASRVTVTVNPRAVTTDIAEFEAALKAASGAGSDLERIEWLASAATLYRGELLPGYYEDWVLTERERLAERYLQALRQLVRLLVAAGDLDRALDYARRAVSADPLREELHCDLIRLLADAGHPAAALQQYRKLERTLREELGATPSPATRRLVSELDRAAIREAPLVPPDRSPAPDRRSAGAGLRGTLTFLAADTIVLANSEVAPTSWSASPVGRPALRSAVESANAIDIEAPPVPSQNGQAVEAARPASLEPLLLQIQQQGGHVLRQSASSVLAAFGCAGDALACAIAGQRSLAGDGLRIGIHTGEQREAPDRKGSVTFSPEDTESRPGMFECAPLEHTMHVLMAAHGGQILCSEATAGLLRREIEAGTRLAVLGLYRLRHEERPERLFQVEYVGMPRSQFPRLKAEGSHTANLPLQLTRFFDREEEIAQISAMLLSEEIRLVTLTGCGGSGKTRLALEVAGRLVEALHAAIWFVPLAELADASRIVEAIRDAMRLPRLPDVSAMEQVVETLSQQLSLLVLDNFDHLVSEGALVVRSLIERVSGLTCLITSRQRLALAGEREFPVAPLPVPGGREDARRQTPDVRYAKPSASDGPSAGLASDVWRLASIPSVQLFVDRAQAARPDFQLTPANAPAVAELCARLEGLPLAIELAAARAQVLTPAQMLAQLVRRFDFLVTRQRGVTPRHQSLRTTLDWSYRLLPLELQQFFRRLAVFRGGFTLEAAEAVCTAPEGRRQKAEGSPNGSSAESSADALTPLPSAFCLLPSDALGGLEQLRECSLVVAEEDKEGIRYRLLETLREYGWEHVERCSEGDLLRRQHARFFLTLAEQAAPKLTGLELEQCFDRLESDHDNLRVALAWALQNEPETGLRLANALWQFWKLRGYGSEGRDWMDRCLEHSAGAMPALRADTLLQMGRSLWNQGEYRRAIRLFEECLELKRQLGDRPGVAYLLINLASAEPYVGEYDRAHAYGEESLEIHTELADRTGIAFSLARLGHVALRRGDMAGARDFYERSLATFRELGDRPGVATHVYVLGIHAICEGDTGHARACFDESLALWRALGDKRGMARSMMALAAEARLAGEYVRAHGFLEEAHTLWSDLGERTALAKLIESRGHLALAEGAPAQARAFYEESLTLRRTLDDRCGIVAALFSLEEAAHAEGDAAGARRWAEERRTLYREFSDPADIVSHLCAAARDALHWRDLPRARAFYTDGLSLAQASGARFYTILCVDGLAKVASAQG